MAEPDDSADFEKRLTWNKGDLKVYGPDGKEVDVSTLKEEEDEEEDNPLAAFPLSPAAEEPEADSAGPTVHLYLDPEDVA